MALWDKIYHPFSNTYIPLKSNLGKNILSKYIHIGGGNCKLCGSPNTNSATCPLNKNSKNKLPEKHPKSLVHIPNKLPNKLPNKRMIKRKYKTTAVNKLNKTKKKNIIQSETEQAHNCDSPDIWDKGAWTHSSKIPNTIIQEDSLVSKKRKIKRKKKIKKATPDTGRAVKPFLQKLKYLIHKHQINLEEDPTSAFKSRVYGKAITILSNYPHENMISKKHIETFLKENGFKNPAKIIVKSNEYIDSGTIAVADRVLTVPALVSAINLTKIYGIGSKKAQSLFNNYGIHTILQLRQQLTLYPKILNAKQKMGLEYYDDLQLRIPRKEMKAYHRTFVNISKKIPGLIFSIAGSFRRELSTSGDIDVLITSSDSSVSPTPLHKKFISLLEKKNIIRSVLANGKIKFMGITKLEDKGFSTARHIDIIHTPVKEYPFALLYFTGSGGFNVKMRGRALKLGYTLNEKYIYNKKTKKPVSSSVILGKIGKSSFEKERDIMKFLDMKYVSPKKRNTITINKI